VAGNYSGPRWARSDSVRPHSFRASNHLRCGRHSIARSRRPCVTWGRASGDPARQICCDVYPQEGQRAFSIASISLFRQRQSCRRGTEFRCSAECGSPIERLYGVARVGFYTYPILGRSELAIQCLSAMDLDLHKRQASGAADHPATRQRLRRCYSTSPPVLADYHLGSTFLDHDPIATALVIALPFVHEDRAYSKPSGNSR
jgi:hypothetical protein